MTEVEPEIPFEGEDPDADDHGVADDDDDQGSDAPPVEESAEPLTEKRVEQIMRSLEREAERHGREVVKRAGPMFDDLVPCPLCTDGPGTVGYIVPQLPEPAQTMRRQAVAMALGGDAEPEYLHDPDKDTCDVCAGLGMLATGSKVPNQEALPCRACTGQGWRQKLAAVAPPPVYTASGGTPQIGTASTSASAPTDTWGRPLGHPHFNIPPAEVGG
jgi:hypothetical protein